MVYADDVNMLRGNVHIIKMNTEALSVASKEIGLEVNADKKSTWSCLEIRMQNAGRSQNINLHNSSFERAEQFKYLGNTFNELKFYSGRK